MVFAYVIGDGMDLVDLLSSVGSYDMISYWSENPYRSAFGEMPLIIYESNQYLETLYSVSVHDVDGDVDFDGDVDIDDYNGFVASFGQKGIGLAADFDGDYDVDLDDFAVLRANYTGPGGSPLASPTPEPTSMCLLGLCCMAMIRKRRGKS